jgi:Na+-driven multidrug efflux pump
VATISYWGLGFPAAYFLGQTFGAVGVWSGMGLGLGLSALLLGILVVKTYRKSF